MAEYQGYLYFIDYEYFYPNTRKKTYLHKIAIDGSETYSTPVHDAFEPPTFGLGSALDLFIYESGKNSKYFGFIFYPK